MSKRKIWCCVNRSEYYHVGNATWYSRSANNYDCVWVILVLSSDLNPRAN